MSDGEITTADRLADSLDNIAEMVANLSAENERLKADAGYRIIGDPTALFAALAKAQAEFPPIERTKTVRVRMKAEKGGGEYTFDYAPLDQVHKVCAPILGRHGLCVLQPFSDGDPFSVTTILAGHGARIESRVTISKAGDVKDQGGSITYIRRYSYCAMVGVQAETDDDGNAASGDQAQVSDRQRGQKPAQQAQQKTATPAPAEQKKAEPPKAESKLTPAPVVAPGHMTAEQSTKISLLKTTLKLNKDETEKACQDAVGKPSPKTSADFTPEDADKLIAHLQKLELTLGAKPNGKPKEQQKPADEPMTGVQFNAIGSLVDDMELSGEEVNAIAQEVLGKPAPKTRADWTSAEADTFYTALVKRKEARNAS